MASPLKPIKVWGQVGANPPNVAILLEELGIPYEVIPISFADVKKPDYLAINPNDRLPSIHNPDTDITLWESRAVFNAIERYTKEVNRVSGVLDGYLAQQKKKYVGSEGPWLVGNKISYADLALVLWQAGVTLILGKDEYDEDNFPHLKKWLGKMTS
ncbi:hypothetical protein BDZ45DRAFT_703829 [Acephala macrosclerotiorum]|nr:hypothetical protein BDZ45DRAFT_703829 [Acephala macrosclerotiorum]